MALRSKNISAFAEQQTVFRGKTPSLQDVLVDRGDVSPDEMFKAVTLQRFENTKLSDLLQLNMAYGMLALVGLAVLLMLGIKLYKRTRSE